SQWHPFEASGTHSKPVAPIRSQWHPFEASGTQSTPVAPSRGFHRGNLWWRVNFHRNKPTDGSRRCR
ncbi:MAG: hypothetical protein ACK55I_16790, partial [bacterium]